MFREELMQNLIDPITADLIFTCLTSAALLAGTFKTMLMLPWTDSEIAATEAAADRLLLGSVQPMQIRSTR